MISNDKLEDIFASELKYLMALSYIVLCNNLVSNRYIERNFDMSVQAWSSLFAIDRFPGIRAKEIQQLFPRPQNTISRAIALLEEKQLVRQVASAGDGRQKELFITDAGSRVLTQIKAVSLQRQSELFDPLSDEERDQFFHLAQKLAQGSALKQSSVMTADNDNAGQ